MRLASLTITLLINLAICQPFVLSQETDGRETKSQKAHNSDKALTIDIPLKCRSPEWWARYIRPERTLADRVEIIQKENENWELARSHNVWLSKGMKLESTADSTHIEVDGRMLEVSKPLATFESKFLSARLASAASDKWSIVAMSLDYPSDTVLYVSGREESFEYKVRTFVTTSVMGRHRQLLHVELADNYGIVYVANYFGASIEVISLEKKASIFKCHLQYQPSE